MVNTNCVQCVESGRDQWVPAFLFQHGGEKEFCGVRNDPSAPGIVFAGFSLAGGLGPYLMGAAYDANRSYALPLVLFCIAVLLAAALMLVLGPYRYDAVRVGRDRQAKDTLESPLHA